MTAAKTRTDQRLAVVDGADAGPPIGPADPAHFTIPLDHDGLHNTLVVADPLVVLGCPDGVAMFWHLSFFQ